jgi:hypothetical protein
MASAMFQGPQMGGANPMNVLFANMDPIQKLLFGVGLIIGIVHVNQIPDKIRETANSLIGRILGIAGIYLVFRYVGWPYAFLFTLFYVLLLQGAPQVQEGFYGMEAKNVERPTSRWFVERVLGERPTRIEINTVGTEDVQDLSEKNMQSRGR